MIQRGGILLVYLFATILPLRLPALPGEDLAEEGCGCSETVAQCCCAAPPRSDVHGWKNCPNKPDPPICLPTLPTHIAPALEIAESASQPVLRPAPIFIPESPLPDPIHVIPRDC
jgi:hypothetical protein